MQLSTTTNRPTGGHLFHGWSWLKKTLAGAAVLTFMTSSFLFLTPAGTTIREKLAQTVITTQHRDWAWIFVGAGKRDKMVSDWINQTEQMGEDKQNMNLIQFRKDRKIDELIKVEDISGKFWKGKKMYVYDPRSVRVVVPNKQGEGERITSMVKRTGAVAGVNGGAFVDPDGLGNGFAPIGFIISGGQLLYTDKDGNIPEHVIGFTDEGTLVVGKYSLPELEKLHVTEGVFWKPRVIQDGKPLITEGDGGWGRGPRTAVGQRADGTLIFVVIDGRSTASVGATLREVQDLLLADGAVNAGFLDGGASSEMVVGGEVITNPSSRYGERRLPSALLIFDHPEDYKADRIWDGLTTIDPGGAYDHPDYLKEQEALRQQGKLNTPTPTPKPSSTKTPTPTPTSNSSSTPKSSQSPDRTSSPTPSGGTHGSSGSPNGGGTPSTGATPPGASGSPQSSAKPGASQTPAGGTPTPKTGATASPNSTASGNTPK